MHVKWTRSWVQFTATIMIIVTIIINDDDDSTKPINKISGGAVAE